MQKDINKVFMNVNEFVDKHMIDGQELDVIEDSNELLDRKESRTQQIDSYQEGMFREQRLIYVKAEQFGKLPRVGAEITYDKKEYQVISAVNEGGIYSINLEALDG